MVLENKHTKYTIKPENIVFNGNTSAVTAYCQISGDNANMHIDMIIPPVWWIWKLEFLSILVVILDILTTKPIHTAAIVVQKAENILTR